MKDEMDVMEAKNRIVREVHKNRSEYEDGLGTEIENFPQAGVIFAREIPHEYKTPMQERIWLARVRAELKALRRLGGKR